MSVTTLQGLENVRKLMGKPFSPTSAFRSWEGNIEADSTCGRSWHMRGRAFDAGDKIWYDTVKADIQAVDVEVWAFQRTTKPDSVSQVYEIEKMPQRDKEGNLVWWLHAQFEPGCDTDP